MDLIKNIHISSVEEAEEILKSEISVNSLFGELKRIPVLKSYGLTKQNVQTKINKIFREVNSNHLTIDLKVLLSGKTQITYKSLRNSLYIGNSAFFFEIQAP